MRQTDRLRIQAAGSYTPSPDQLDDSERRLVFRAVQTVIESDGFLAQPGADMLVGLRSEFNLTDNTDLGDELTYEELGETNLSAATADYLCYMSLLAGYADGKLSDSEAKVISTFCRALGMAENRRKEIEFACQRAILEVNILMNLPEVIESSELAQHYREELGLDEDALETVARAILQGLYEA